MILTGCNQRPIAQFASRYRQATVSFWPLSDIDQIEQQFLTMLSLLQVQDVEGVELCGTLKNVVAIAAGN